MLITKMANACTLRFDCFFVWAPDKWLGCWLGHDLRLSRPKQKCGKLLDVKWEILKCDNSVKSWQKIQFQIMSWRLAAFYRHISGMWSQILHFYTYHINKKHICNQGSEAAGMFLTLWENSGPGTSSITVPMCWCTLQSSNIAEFIATAHAFLMFLFSLSYKSNEVN